ncbi:MAG: septation protein A [Giesbergeria sp.]
MKFLFDLFPVILFFVAFKIAGANVPIAHDFAARWLGEGIAPSQAPILIATAVAIIATFGQIAWVWLRRRKVDTMLWVSLAIIAVFGGATLYLHDETFIKWKPTVLYWLFASVLGASALIFRKNLIRTMLGEQIQLPDPAWNKLNLSWAGFFTCMGFLNLYVAFNFSTDTWVNFKLFGGMGLMLAFVIGQALFLAKYVEQKESK